MARNWTHSAAFAHFGATPRNVQWSWSARSETGTVVVTLWQDQFVKGLGGKLTYTREAIGANDGDSRPGFRELMENLQYARDHCEGLFNVIIAKAKDLKAHPRSIERCWPSDMLMKLTAFDPMDGTFTAMQVIPADA